MAKKGGLGRGLVALVSETSGETYSQPHDEEAVLELPLRDITPNSEQPRSYFDEEKLQSLCDSVREVGILQPILVRKVDDTYQIIAGERRYQAALRAGLERVPVVIRDSSDIESLQLALIENIQRSDLSAIEEALAYKDLIQKTGMTQEELGKRLSKSRSAIANTLRLLELSDSIQSLVIDGKMSAGHARALLGIEDVQQRELLAEKIVREGLSVRQTEKLVSQSGKPRATTKMELPKKYKTIARQLSESIGTNVKIKSNRDALCLEIACKDEEALMAMIDLLDSKR